MPILAETNEDVLNVLGASSTTKMPRMVPPLLVLSSMMAEMKKQVRRIYKTEDSNHCCE
jgi:hypothetical protein